MKRVIATILLLVIIPVVAIMGIKGTKKVVNTDYDTVDVTIVGKHHSSRWLQPIKTGNSTMFINHAAQWHIIVEYNGVKYTIDDEDTYNQYKGMVGQSVSGILEITTYDDNSTLCRVVSLD